MGLEREGPQSKLVKESEGKIVAMEPPFFKDTQFPEKIRFEDDAYEYRARGGYGYEDCGIYYSISAEGTIGTMLVVNEDGKVIAHTVPENEE
ncbi:MAG: hypothetical protein Q7S28_01685 [bacterium]|nr:hypothetical protein [bacterium]